MTKTKAVPERAGDPTAAETATPVAETDPLPVVVAVPTLADAWTPAGDATPMTAAETFPIALVAWTPETPIVAHTPNNAEMGAELKTER